MDIMPHRTLLIFDLPSEMVEKNRDVIEICIHKMKLQNVEIRYGIQNIKDIAGYDLVFLLSHTINDSFLISDNNTFSFGEFINLLPSSFKGVLETNACFTTSIAPLIRKKCPQCRRIHTFDSSKGLENALFLLPSIVELFYTYPDLDYQDIYVTAKNLLKQTVEENPSNDAKETTKLGNIEKVAMPETVVREVTYPFHVFILPDNKKSEREMINNIKKAKSKAVFCYTNSISDLTINDQLDIYLDFDKRDIKGGGHKEKVWTGTMIEARFSVFVPQDFEESEFMASVVIKCNGKLLDDNCLNIPIDVVKYKSEDYSTLEMYNQLNGLEIAPLVFQLEKEPYHVLLKRYRNQLKNKLKIEMIRGTLRSYYEEMIKNVKEREVAYERVRLLRCPLNNILSAMKEEYENLFIATDDIKKVFESFIEETKSIDGSNEAEKRLLLYLRRINVFEGRVKMVPTFLDFYNEVNKNFVTEVAHNGEGKVRWENNIMKLAYSYFNEVRNREIDPSFYNLCKSSTVIGTKNFFYFKKIDNEKENIHRNESVSYAYLFLLFCSAKGKLTEDKHLFPKGVQFSRAKGLINYLKDNKQKIQDYYESVEGKTSVFIRMLLPLLT